MEKKIITLEEWEEMFSNAHTDQQNDMVEEAWYNIPRIETVKAGLDILEKYAMFNLGATLTGKGKYKCVEDTFNFLRELADEKLANKEINYKVR